MFIFYQLNGIGINKIYTNKLENNKNFDNLYNLNIKYIIIYIYFILGYLVVIFVLYVLLFYCCCSIKYDEFITQLYNFIFLFIFIICISIYDIKYIKPNKNTIEYYDSIPLRLQVLSDIFGIFYQNINTKEDTKNFIKYSKYISIVDFLYNMIKKLFVDIIEFNEKTLFFIGFGACIVDLIIFLIKYYLLLCKP